MSSKKDVNKVSKTASKAKPAQSPTSSAPVTPSKRGYDPVDDSDFIWTVLYKAADAPKPNYKRAAELMGMPYNTVVGRFWNIKKLHEGTPITSPTATPTPKQRKMRKSKVTVEPNADISIVKEGEDIKSEPPIKNEFAVEVNVQVEENNEDEA